MRIRTICAADYPALRKIHAERDYKFEIPELGSLFTEEAMIVESETGEVIAAGFAVSVPEIVLLMNHGHPVVKLEAIRRIHDGMRANLKRKGYERALAVVSPSLKSFARHLIRKFQWVNDFPSYRVKI